MFGLKPKIKFRFRANVLRKMCGTICRYPAETGGILGSDDGGRTVTHFHFDAAAHTTGSTYSPDISKMNQVKDAWNAAGIEFVGIVHSHPHGRATPSPEDIRYGKRIMQALGLKRFCMPIINIGNPPNGSLELHPYCIDRRFRFRLRKQPVIATDAWVKQPCDEKPYYTEAFARIATAIPQAAMRKKTVVCIGTGGAMSFVEELARCGVGNFILIDGDRVSASNIATQQAYLSEIGRYKVDVLRDRIRDINPTANVKAVRGFLDNAVSDSQFSRIAGKALTETPRDTLICGCTDSFHAQARSAALAMKYGTPYLAAQLYKNGMAAEIYFSYPGVTNHSCPRCAMSSRYEAYARGYQNNVTSGGAPIFATTRVNSLKGQIALMLLLHGEKDCAYGDMLGKIADRNFVLIRMNPLAGRELGIGIFDEMDSGLSFFDETVWIPQTPNTDPPCPLCGGTGNLLSLKGNLGDTRLNWQRGAV